jgi:phage/plasmid-like protein (TIGR03299 family)
MAHELTQREDGTYEGMFVGDKPWHGLGVLLDEHQTPSEALNKAKLDWDVEKRAVKYLKHEETETPGVLNSHYKGTIADRFATVRSDNQKYLGVVGTKYVPIQNKAQADFIEALTGEGEAVVECAGSLFGGRKVFWTCKLPTNIVINETDNIEKYLIFANDHGGRGSFTCYFSSTRVVCNNTLQLSSNSAQNRVNIRHTGDVTHKIAEAKRILGLSIDKYEEAEENYNELASLQINPAHVTDLLMQSFGLDDNSRKNTIKDITACYESEKAIAVNPNSAWTLYNGVTRYTTHGMGKNRGKRFDSLLNGKGSRINAEAMDIIRRAGTAIMS